MAAWRPLCPVRGRAQMRSPVAGPVVLGARPAAPCCGLLRTAAHCCYSLCCGEVCCCHSSGCNWGLALHGITALTAHDVDDVFFFLTPFPFLRVAGAAILSLAAFFAASRACLTAAAAACDLLATVLLPPAPTPSTPARLFCLLINLATCSSSSFSCAVKRRSLCLKSSAPFCLNRLCC